MNAFEILRIVHRCSYDLGVDTEMRVYVVHPAPLFPKPLDKRRENPQFPGFYPYQPIPKKAASATNPRGGPGSSNFKGGGDLVKPFQTLCK